MKIKTCLLLVLFVGFAASASALEPRAGKSSKRASKSRSSFSLRTVQKVKPPRILTVDDNNFRNSKQRFVLDSAIIFDDNHFSSRIRTRRQVWIGPLGGDGVFIGPLGGDGVFKTLVDRMASGQLSKVGKVDEDCNLILSPRDLSSMQQQALKTGDVEVLGIVVIVLRQVEQLSWWTLDGSNL